ncbi:hypothetical protein [Aquincola sp. J276]|uniref:hypothetical protein n=1 Tax=Aquincola sp. J276 TaxID=2898432 RepID=UPI002150B88A|nr:hypothetical protein [Aquincola sp. J276]MCR5866040.1 hypothetical protein [Aquincola sp. J276]
MNTRPAHRAPARMPSLAGLAAAVVLAAASALPAHAQIMNSQGCGPMYIPTHVGPFDYRNQREMLRTVEFGHFQPNVEDLIKPMFNSFGADIDYTLKAYPNHHRALITLNRLSLREKALKTSGSDFSVECYFFRAIRWRPDDLIVRMIYASWLHQWDRTKDAVQQLDYVVDNAGDDPFTHYNAGMVFADLKIWDRALQQAHAAQALDFPKGDLKARLVEAGKWQEPVPGAPLPGRAAASAPALPASAASAPASR